MKAMERARERKLVDSLTGVGSVPFAVCVWGTDLRFTVPTAYSRRAPSLASQPSGQPAESTTSLGFYTLIRY
jgi:hypothetical protein